MTLRILRDNWRGYAVYILEDGMDTHAMLIELLAIKLFEHHCIEHPGNILPWHLADEEDRKMYRDKITAADDPEILYAEDEP
jgi:hypothetical protein